MLRAAPKKKDGAAPVAKLNGESITQNEIDCFTRRFRTDVINACMSEYSVTFEDEFWDAPLDGKTPAERLSEKALTECVRAKVQFVLFREKGIYESISYEALLEKALAFNSKSSGEVTAPGLKSIDLDSFYTYYLETGALEYMNSLEKDYPELSDAEIGEKYNELVDTMAAAAVVSENTEK